MQLTKQAVGIIDAELNRITKTRKKVFSGVFKGDQYLSRVFSGTHGISILKMQEIKQVPEMEPVRFYLNDLNIFAVNRADLLTKFLQEMSEAEGTEIETSYEVITIEKYECTIASNRAPVLQSWIREYLNAHDYTFVDVFLISGTIAVRF